MCLDIQCLGLTQGACHSGGYERNSFVTTCLDAPPLCTVRVAHNTRAATLPRAVRLDVFDVLDLSCAARRPVVLRAAHVFFGLAGLPRAARHVLPRCRLRRSHLSASAAPAQATRSLSRLASTTRMPQRGSAEHAKRLVRYLYESRPSLCDVQIHCVNDVVGQDVVVLHAHRAILSAKCRCDSGATC